MSVEPLKTVNGGYNTELNATVSALGQRIVKLLEHLRATYLKRKQQRIDRDAFNNMLTLDDRALTDIGVKREDLLWASNLPLSTNAALELKALRSGKKNEKHYQS